MSRSSTPAPPDHDDEGSDEDEEHQTPQTSADQVSFLSQDNISHIHLVFFLSLESQ